MDFTHVNRLKEEQEKVLQLCEAKISQWEKFWEDYGALQGRLETLPDALSYDITVPFGSQAFAKGKLVRTNEVMVLLGDNWFAEVSARQAAAIAQRRTQHCVTMLADLQKEKNQLQNWSKYIEEVSAKEDLVEIAEEYNEEEEKRWREQHRLNVRVHRQQLARERRHSGGSSTGGSCSEEEFSQRLHSLEEEEEVGQGEKRAHLRLDCSRSEEAGLEGEGSGSSPEGGKHVRWQDLTKQKNNVRKITFRHSKNHQKQHHYHHPPLTSSPEGEEVAPPKVQSPSDIYRQFEALLQPSPPKSILKVKQQQLPPSPSSDSEDASSAHFELEEEETPNNSKAFTGEVRESSDPIPIQQKRTSSRPTSHFKNSRKNKKK